MCLVLANSREVGFRIKQAVQARGIDIRSFFKEEPVEKPIAQEKLALLTLLATPEDRPALRSWIGLGTVDGLIGSYRAVLHAAQEQNTDIQTILHRLDADEITVAYSGHALVKWRALKQQLEPLEDLGDDVRAVINAVFPETGLLEAEDPLALLRNTALSCINEVETLRDLPEVIRYRIGQPEVPLETAYARVMSFHKSKGLTADLVVLAGLVDGLIPRFKGNITEAERTAQLEEQRRLFFVGMTRTTNILVFSSYSQLPSRLANSLQVRKGNFNWISRTYGTFPTPFLEETGAQLPNAIRGQQWLRNLGLA